MPPPSSGSRLEDHLGLSDDREQTAFGGSDAGLPDHRSATAMDRCTLAPDGGSERGGREEIGLRLKGGGVLTTLEIEECRPGAECVRERHHRAAMQDVRRGA